MAMATAHDTWHQQSAPYAPGEERPLEQFAAMIGVYAVVTATAAYVAGRRGVAARPAWTDLALATVATYRTARLISKDSVTSPLRAPFARFEEAAGEGEVNEQVRGTGWRKAIGELLTCPFCIGQWAGTVWIAGLALAPRTTRWAAAAMSVMAGSDALQFGRAALRRVAE
jgi:Protein of unknown function (DUF1360)